MAEPISTSPLISRFARLGVGQFEVRDGWRVVRTFATPDEELEVAKTAVAISDESARTKILVQGDGAEALFEQLGGAPAPAICQGARLGEGERKGGDWGGVTLYRLRSDLFFVSAAPGRGASLMASLRDRPEGFGNVTPTDVTHGRAEFRIVGPASRDLLAKLCGLDFDNEAFPNLACRQSSLAKTRMLIARCDVSLPSGDRITSVSIIGGRSFGGYVWDTTIAAGKGLGIGLLGSAASDFFLRD